MSVGRLLDEMTSQELTEWMALYKIEASEREQQQQRAKAQAKRKR